MSGQDRKKKINGSNDVRILIFTSHKTYTAVALIDSKASEKFSDLLMNSHLCKDIHLVVSSLVHWIQPSNVSAVRIYKHSHLLVFWFTSYIVCTIVLLVSKVTSLQNPRIETDSIEALMVSDTLDSTGFQGCSLTSCGRDLLTAYTFSLCGH